MKGLLASVMVLMVGCVSMSGLKTLETKYVPGDCLKLTDETILRDFPVDAQATAKSLDLQVLGLTQDGYVLGQFVAVEQSGMPVAQPSLFKTESVNKDTVAVECPAYLAPKVEPADPEAE